MHLFTSIPAALAAAVLATTMARAGVSAVPPVPSPGRDMSAFDQLWSLATLYKNDGNPWIEEFKLRGRYQGQYHWLQSEQGHDSGWENRRSQFGFNAKLFDRKIEIRSFALGNDAFDPFYDRLADAYIKWIPSSAFSLTLGKQKPQLGYYDWLQSSSTQPTFERSQIFGQLRVDRATGAVAEGRTGRFLWQVGGYSNEVDRELGQFRGGYSLGAGIGYDFRESLGFQRADWRFDWLHSQRDIRNTVLNRYDHLICSTLWLEDAGWSLVAEAFLGTGESPTVFGAYLQPTYDLQPKKLQLVGRVSLSVGDGPQSVTAQTRYERAAPNLTGSGRGESYQAAYLGLQYFLHGDNVKFMAGAEYAHLSGGGDGGDYDGWTVLTGVRVSF